MPDGLDAGAAALSSRERDVLARLHLPDKAIARELGISRSTVKMHCRSIYKKLGVKNRTQAALAVREL